MLSVFGSKAAKFSGAGALGVLTMATVAAYGWGTDAKVNNDFWSSFYLMFIHLEILSDEVRGLSFISVGGRGSHYLQKLNRGGCN